MLSDLTINTTPKSIKCLLNSLSGLINDERAADQLTLCPASASLKRVEANTTLQEKKLRPVLFPYRCPIRTTRSVSSFFKYTVYRPPDLYVV